MAVREPNWRAYAKDNQGDLFLYDDIGPDHLGMIGLKTVSKALDKMGPVASVRVHINSVGGDVVEGTGIYNALKKHSARVDVEIDGAAYSIASLIAMAGDKITMAENALMMIHNPWAYAVGDSAELRKRAEALDLMREAAVGVYVSRTGNSRAAVSSWMDDETWFTSSEAIAAGFANQKSANKAVAAKFDPKQKGYRNAPIERVAALHVSDQLECGPLPAGDRQVCRQMARALRGGASPADLGQFLRQL